MLVAQSLVTLVEGFEPEKQFALLVIAMGCLTGIAITLGITIAYVINSIHRRNADNQLKREMLGMGLGGDEIARVVEATSAEPETLDQQPQG